MDPEAIAKAEFHKGMLDGAFASGKPINFDDIRMLSGMSGLLVAACKKANFPCPMHIRAEAAVMDDEFKKADKLDKELGPYMDKDHLACIESLAYQRKFASPEENARNLAQAEKEMEKLLENARKKKAQAEEDDKKDAEYQKRKAENRQARAAAPVPEEKALPAVGKAIKKDEDDMSAFCGAGSGKKGKRK